MRVLHVAQPIEGGVAVYVADLLADQARAGLDVALAAPRDLRPPEARHRGATWLPWDAGQRPDHHTVRELRELRRVLATHQPDLVHLHSAKAGLAGRLLLRGQVPTVFQPHSWSFEAVTGTLAAATRAWERWAARWTHVVACVSVAERDRGRREGIEAACAVVPNGVDLRRLRPAADADRAGRATVGLPEGPLVVFAGRLHRQKGVDVLLDAWSSVRCDVPDATLVIAGDGPERATLTAAAPAEVAFLGHHPEPAALMAHADVVVLPSRWEGLSLVLLEAMAVGACVVATEVDGAGDCLAEAGGLVPPEDPVALSSAILERLLDPARRQHEGTLARKHVETHHDVRDTRTSIRDLYQRVHAAHL